MGGHEEFRDAFKTLTWAAPFLDHPDWHVYPRRRSLKPRPSEASYDGYCEATLRNADGIQQWAELSQKPAPGSKSVTRTISLFKYGIGLTGYESICHGGAVMTMMDEAFGNMMLTVQRVAVGLDPNAWLEHIDKEAILSSVTNVFVTAQLNFSFLKPVLNPGVVGVDCTLVELKGRKMRIEAVMKDAQGTPLVKAESVWIRLDRVRL